MDPAVSGKSSVTPAPYGQACTNCSRAKYRCIYRSDRRECERCHRLEKECVPSVSRRLAGRRSTGPRTVDLEEKIQDLMALLRNQAAGDVDSHVDPPAASIVTPAPSDELHSNRTVGDYGSGTGSGKSFTPETAGPVHSEPVAQGDGVYRAILQAEREPSLLLSAFEIRPHQAEDCLAYFQTHMLNSFPFMYLRPDITTRQLREWYPFLWFNIMAVTAKQRVTDQESSMTDSIKRFVAQKTVVDNEASLDLLLGLLVFMNWFHYHHKGRSYIIIMVALASSLISDMGLNKASHATTQVTTPCNNDRQVPPQDAKTAAGRRAVLAHFLLVSQISYAQKKIDPPEWTSYLDECLQTVTLYPEWSGDEQLAAQLKVQLLVDQISRGPWKNQEYQPSISYTSTLQAQLERIKTQLPRSLGQNVNMTCQLLYTELVIQDAILTKQAISPHFPNYQRQQLVETHLTTIMRCFDSFFAIPSDQFPGVSFIRWCQMAHDLILLHRLYVLDEPSWDRAAARERVDLFNLCDRLVRLLGETAASCGSTPGGDDNIFIRFSRMIWSMCSTWWAELQSTERIQQTGSNQRQLQGPWSGPNMDTDFGVMSGATNGGYSAVAHPFTPRADDAWLDEIFNME
ncbi:Uu.00g056240.m01.CDS01 [Anthostomella pinea]|uniref:Uu.00g056240.m01.CDS01 n=1 Tax=Anthostomella pinea TaxID=933095 RepID=A0AAI8YM33_9PEZI|nr:Uu.00g056240.m01.CDS01 [Anthostomella pinea]